jgi:hypothetical protein
MSLRFEVHKNADDSVIAEGIQFSDGVCITHRVTAPHFTESWANQLYMTGDWSDRQCNIVWIDQAP